MNEWVSEWVNELMNQWTNAWIIILSQCSPSLLYFNCLQYWFADVRFYWSTACQESWLNNEVPQQQSSLSRHWPAALCGEALHCRACLLILLPCCFAMGYLLRLATIKIYKTSIMSMFIFVCNSVTANQNGCMRGQHFACVLPLRRCPMLLIYCPVLKSLQPQLPLLSFTASTSFGQVCSGMKLFSLERGRPCECVQQCWSQQDEWNRGPSFPSFISKLWLNSKCVTRFSSRHCILSARTANRGQHFSWTSYYIYIYIYIYVYIYIHHILRHSVQHKKHVETVECSRTKAPLLWQLSFVPASWTQS